MVVRGFKKYLRFGLLATVLLLAGFTIPGGTVVAWAEELTWKDETFNVTFWDADVRDVLTDLLKRNGKTAVFLPGVQGTITFDFRNNPMPLEAAFNKVLAENNLMSMFDADNNSVRILLASASAIVDEIFTPKYSDLQHILDAFARFNLGSGVTITADHISNVLFFHGTQSDVATLKRVASEIDASLQNQLTRRLKDLEQQRLQSSVSVEEHRAQLEKEKIDSERAITVEVIPLRYTSVAPTTTQFQGEKVTLPGIMDSLRAFVGPITELDASQAEANKAVVTSNKPVVSVDIRTNSIVVQGSPEQIKRVADVVKKLDKEVPLVEIEVIIVDGSLGASRTFGIQLGSSGIFGPNVSQIIPSTEGTIANLALGTPPDAVAIAAKAAASGAATAAALARGATAQAAAAAGDAAAEIAEATSAEVPMKVGAGQALAGAGGLGAQFIYRGTREFLETTISALATNGKLQTVASPRVVTLNNLPANISNTTKITNLAVPAGTSITVGDSKSSGQSQSSVEGGITLVITPSVILTDEDDGSRLVRLTIDAKNSSVTPPTGGMAVTTGQGVQTNIIIPDGATFIMGGLFSTTRIESNSGVPFLKDIPVVGHLFGTKDSQDSKKETLFLITPKVFSYKDIITTQRVRAKDYMEDQRSFLVQEQRGLETESQLLSMPQIKISEDE